MHRDDHGDGAACPVPRAGTMALRPDAVHTALTRINNSLTGPAPVPLAAGLFVDLGNDCHKVTFNALNVAVHVAKKTVQDGDPLPVPAEARQEIQDDPRQFLHHSMVKLGDGLGVEHFVGYAVYSGPDAAPPLVPDAPDAVRDLLANKLGADLVGHINSFGNAFTLHGLEALAVWSAVPGHENLYQARIDELAALF